MDKSAWHVGHFFNLDHTFGNGDGCGPDDDGIADTPKVGDPSFSCPGDGSVAGCVSGEAALTMNYMDYVDDACMYMFTVGQKNVALAYINAILSDFKTNVLASDSFYNSSFSVYPNPSKGTFNLQFKEVVTDFNVEIFDITGKMVYVNEFYQNSDLVKEIKIEEEISKGVYFMTIKTNEGLVTKKIIIE